MRISGFDRLLTKCLLIKLFFRPIIDTGCDQG
jgi:hypothetical protein